MTSPTPGASYAQSEVSCKTPEESNATLADDSAKADQDKEDFYTVNDSSPEEASRLSGNDEIIYHYLTFNTELPQPAYLLQSLPTGSLADKQPAQCPDLTPYTNPFHWPRRRKNLMTWLGCIATTITAYTAGSYAAGNEQYMAEWGISEPLAEVGIALFTAGFAIAPMFLAPFSEINGRRPVFVITGALFVVFQLVCALTPTFAGMLVARFLVGCMCSTFSTMVGGIISDYYHAADRNWAMAVFAGGAIGGTGLGPLCSGFIAQHTTWRWIFRLQVITTGVLIIIIVVLFKESRGSILLSRKAKVLNRWYDELEAAGFYGHLMPMDGVSAIYREKRIAQRIRWKVKSDEERASLPKMISLSLYRPFHLLVTEPVVLFFSLWITFAWCALYLLFSAVPLIYSTRYGFNIAESGAVFAVVTAAAILSTIINVYQEPVARRWLTGERRQAFLSTPEGRLMFCCVQSSLLPIGCFWFGWTCYSDIHWIVPTLGVGCATMGISSIYLAVFNYLADCYHRYASSALAAQSFVRNMVAGSFPIYTAYMFRGLTYGGAGSLLGGISALLTIVPWVLVFYGPKIRARSKIARQLLIDKNTA